MLRKHYRLLWLDRLGLPVLGVWLAAADGSGGVRLCKGPMSVGLEVLEPLTQQILRPWKLAHYYACIFCEFQIRHDFLSQGKL